MTQTKQKRTETHRVQMRKGGSVSTRRRSKKKKSVLPQLFAGILAAALLICALLAFGWKQQLAEQHRFDGYPLQFTQEVEAAAQEFDVEPAYIYAVILAESSFRPNAVSNVGALGLMQVMPETGQWLAGKLDMGDWFTEDMLTNPELNVRMGSWYLHYLLDRYNGDKRCASAAYHAGQGTVDQWLADAQYSADGKTLTCIASDVTDNYVNKVLKNYEVYLELLSKTR